MSGQIELSFFKTEKITLSESNGTRNIVPHLAIDIYRYGILHKCIKPDRPVIILFGIVFCKENHLPGDTSVLIFWRHTQSVKHKRIIIGIGPSDLQILILLHCIDYLNRTESIVYKITVHG